MPKNLVIQLARFGDLIQTKRLILTLQREGEVHLALDRSLAALAALVYPGVVLHPLRVHGAETSPQNTSLLLAENFRAFGELQRIGFHKVYNLNRSPLALAISGLFDPDRISGYRLEQGQPVSPVWAQMAARWTAHRRSSPINLMDFWAFFHPDPIDPARVNPSAGSGSNTGKKNQRIGVALAGREVRRSLPPAVLAPMLEAIFAARKGPEFVLFGSAAEEAQARQLMRNLNPKIGQRVENLAGKTSLADLHESMQGLNLFISPDTGLMHLAAHLGVPVMATFLSSAWAWETGPYGLGHTVWQAVEPCSPCLESAPCAREAACLSAFRSPDWLAHLAGRHSGGWPENLAGLVSTLDDLGVTYLCVDGDEEALARNERLARRSLLAEYLGLARAGSRPAQVPPQLPPHLVDELLAANDWML